MESDQLLIDLFQAYFDARKHKRNTRSALAFEFRYEQELFRLHEDIVNRRYEILPSIAFIVDRPVKREVFAANFRDRVVHHLLFNYINPVFDPAFIHDSYSCRKGKGTLYGIRRLEHFIRSCSENYRKECWVLKMDIEGYFMSINRGLLFDKVMARLSRKREAFRRYPCQYEDIRYLLAKVIFNDPTENYIIKGKHTDWQGLPPTKSLFSAMPGCGLPIGNLTSQLFSNIYLDGFDHFVKEDLGMRYYGRYVDDFVLVDSKQAVLLSSVPTIEEFLYREARLRLHPRKRYLQPCEHGVVFLGAVIKPWRKYLLNRTKGNWHQQLREWQKDSLNEKSPLSRERLREMECTTNSYLGGSRHYNTYRMRRQGLRRSGLSRAWFKTDAAYTKVNCLKQHPMKVVLN